MARVKRAVNAHKKRRTVLERAKGYRGQRSRLYRKAKEQLLHSFNYNYRDRKARKGTKPSDHAPVIVDLDDAPDGNAGPMVPPPSRPAKVKPGAVKLPHTIAD